MLIMRFLNRTTENLRGGYVVFVLLAALLWMGPAQAQSPSSPPNPPANNATPGVPANGPSGTGLQQNPAHGPSGEGPGNLGAPQGGTREQGEPHGPGAKPEEEKDEVSVHF